MIKSEIDKIMKDVYIPEKAYFKCQWYEQKTNYTCWTASVRMIVDFYEDGRNYDEDVLVRYLNSQPIVWTETDNIYDFFIRYDYCVFQNEQSSLKLLEYFVSRGCPVIINYRNMLWNVGHFAVVTGYTKNNLILNDPWNWELHLVNKKEFVEKLWISGDLKRKEYLLVPIKKKYFNYCAIDEIKHLFNSKEL